MKTAWFFLFVSCCLPCMIQHVGANTCEVSENISPEKVIAKKRAVFRIFSIGEQDFRSGTGFLISKDGLIATNSHVVHNASDITVYILSEDGTCAYEATAKIAKEDEEKDLAIIRLQNIPHALPEPFKLCDEPATVLEEVLAMGFPTALDRPLSVAADISGKIIKDPTFIENLDPNVTKGAISKVGSWIIHDAKISSGNSGGPLVSLKTGRVLGVNTAKTQGATSFYMAIPINDALYMAVDVLSTNDYTERQEKLAENGDVDAMVSLAWLLYERQEEDKRDPQRALALMKKAAALGNKEALDHLGHMYSDNKSIKPDAELAIKYLTESGTAHAKLRLCEIYLNGLPSCNLKPAPAKGFRFVKEFADSTRNAIARQMLASCYRKGIGTKRNLAEAERILRKLIEEDIRKNGFSFMLPSYRLDLGETLLEGTDRKKIDEGIGILKVLSNPPEFIHAFDNIKGDACRLLGNWYFFGEKNQKDERLGVYYYQLGAEVKQPSCMFLLGLALLYGDGIEKNEKLGFSFIQQAIDLGITKKAYSAIANYLLKNNRKKEALPFLQMAAMAGCGDSACIIATLYYFGEDGIKKDRTAAVKILTHVINSSDNPKDREHAREVLLKLTKTSPRPSASSKKTKSAKPTPRVQPQENSHRW